MLSIKRLGTCALALAVCVGLAPSARADGGGLYLSLAAGGQLLSDNAFSGSGGTFQPELSAGTVVAGAVGYELPVLPVRIELEGMYRNGGISNLTATSGTPLVVGTSFSGFGSFNVIAGMVNGIIFLPVPFGIEPYIGGGIGYARISANNLGAAATQLVDGSDDKLAYQGIVGVEFDIIPGPVDFGIEYRYFAAESASLSGTGGNFSVKYEAHTALARIRLSL